MFNDLNNTTMNTRIKLIKSFIIGLAISAIYACGGSDDDGTTPPPTVDCSDTGPSISLSATATDCGADDGSIEVTVTGGTGSLDVTLDPQPLDFNFDNNTFTDLEPGSYTVQVTDDDNCSTSETAVVGMEGGGVSYINDVDPIVQSKCATPSCHVAGNALGIPDYTVFANFQARANNDPGGVRQRVKTDDMPRTGDGTQPGDPLTAEEKQALFCWIDEGAQNN
jgi:hypothetical protein